MTFKIIVTRNRNPSAISLIFQSTEMAELLRSSNAMPYLGRNDNILKLALGNPFYPWWSSFSLKLIDISDKHVGAFSLDS